MLTLRLRDMDYKRNIPANAQYFDMNINFDRHMGNTYISSTDIADAMAPIVLNGIPIVQSTYVLNKDQEEKFKSFKDVLANIFETSEVDRLTIIRIYTDDMTKALATVGEQYVAPASAVQDLYNKCMSQVELRDTELRGTLSVHPQTIVKVSRAKRILLLFTNYFDSTQASDQFLTIGLTPILFPELKPKFSESEMEYFKVLVNRSQVKRISNVKAAMAFQDMENEPKYQTMLQQIKINNMIDAIVVGKIQSVDRGIRNILSNCESLMKDYEAQQQKYYQYQQQKELLANHQADAVSEIKTALHTEGIVNVEQSSSNALDIYIKVPVSFYNVDEVECVVNRMEDTWIKRFYKDVFIDQTYKLNVINKFKFIFDNDSSFREPGSIETYVLDKYKCLFNPHTYFFRCLGNYKPQLIKAQANQDLLMFVNLAVASTKSINFRDGAVIGRWTEFLRDLLNSSQYNASVLASIQCLEDEQGNLHSLKEIYLNSPTQPETEVHVIEPELV